MKFTRNIVPLLKAQLQNDPVDLKIFSPYLTGEVALEIARLGKSAKVYTLVNVPVLASGASSYATLKTLLDNQIAVYVLPDLHAKLIIAQDRFVTLGSQNLTQRGETDNLEANIRVRGVSKGIQALVAKMERKATLLTPEYLQRVNEAAQALAAEYAALDKKAERAQRAVIAADRERRAALRSVSGIDAEVRSKLASRPQSNPRECKIKKDERAQYLLKGKELLKWTIDGEDHGLDPQHRYLCVSLAGKLGWVRVNQTRYSFIESQVDIEQGEIKGRATWQMSVDASDKACAARKGDHNLRVTVLNRLNQELCDVFMRYNTEDMDIYPAVLLRKTGKPRACAEERRKAVAWINNNAERFKRDVKRVITSPFKFEKNLTGERADAFFGPEGTSHTLCLVKLRTYVALQVLESTGVPLG
ncbi:phospholipase D-like domain-containing protein [Pseudomonas xantholysinigenes]|uniref:PLD phosphodiesterase domain-containing protein n=1 Tax=Pseudomonas xantholysinigenes TaxID=2745490 RepID=A0A9E6Q276_9PSED|nr:phospholipase D-like domain-containing protein [Pseudomonas xantholysinigenes]QXI40391.1 hypothetical protein HU772_010095 [Pseudomonas xantholysinigenes]